MGPTQAWAQSKMRPATLSMAVLGHARPTIDPYPQEKEDASIHIIISIKDEKLQLHATTTSSPDIFPDDNRFGDADSLAEKFLIGNSRPCSSSKLSA
ncbi:hypothetical protein NL676_035226 [Syzygium grande]|nr:hypothetical protein NL676_035226 [Syzygium grande]